MEYLFFGDFFTSVRKIFLGCARNRTQDRLLIPRTAPPGLDFVTIVSLV